ncbi:MAG: hypothetical protein K8R17_00780 [Methanosarcinales archaeon]|nr:hypothetical protein [Methanosarcinales archaeon]
MHHRFSRPAPWSAWLPQQGGSGLRYPSAPHRSELEGAALVRELHVYGPLVGVGLKLQAREWQHRGYGEELLAETTEILILALLRVGCADSGGSSVQILI